MFDWLVLLALAVLAAPIVAIVALVSLGGLRRDLRLLELRIDALESRAPAAPTTYPGTATPAAQPPSAPVPSGAAEFISPLPTARPAPPAPAPAAPAAPAAAAAPPTSVPHSSAAPLSRAQPISFEERFGTRSVVWVGGVALALGGIFLVRYTIEQGLIGRVRIMLGVVLALALITAGEWQRRSERLWGLPGLPSADIPSILTAAGTTVAYATVYAA